MTDSLNEEPPRVVSEWLQSLWCELLRVPAVAAGENFIELGGDSIAATMCALRIAERFGVEIQVSTVLEGSFGALVDEIEQSLSSAGAGRSPLPSAAES
jgi:hypothetical protein